MTGEPEKIYASHDGSVIEVARGNVGAVLINISNAPRKIETLKTTLPDGKYNDEVHGMNFEVENGVIKGSLAPLKSYIILKK